MCSMIYEQPHHQQQSHLDSTSMMTSSSDTLSPSFGPTSAIRQAPGKENALVGLAAGSVQSSVVPGVEAIDDGELRLEVTCGQNQATLYTGRLQLGSKGTCVLFENAWLTPNEFQYVSGRETAKDWKRSIKHHGKSLKVLIAKGILTTSPPARCDCGQCNTSPRKSSGGSDCTMFSSNSGDNKNSSADETWRSGVHNTSADSGSTTTGSAFRPPPDVLSPVPTYGGVTEQLPSNMACSSVDEAFAARSQLKSNGHHQPLTSSGGDPTHVAAASAASLSSPDSRSKKPTSGLTNGSQKRTRSPSSDSQLDHPPSKHQLMDGAHHGSESSSGRGGEHQSRISYGSESSSSRNHQRQQFSPSADGGSQRRRDQSSHTSTSNGQCRSSQSSGFKSPSSSSLHPNSHYQNGASGSHHQLSTAASHKTSPANGVTASTDHRLSSTDASCVISPLAATPYFPFLAAAAAATTTAAQLPNPVCYPNPYMMLPLAAAAAAYQNPSAGQFPSPYSWSSPMTSSAPSIVGSQSSAGASGGPAFDFPWMRGGIGQSAGSSSYSSKLSPTPSSMVGDPYELAKQSSTFGLGSAMQSAYGYRGGAGSSASAAAGFGGLFAAAADGLDAYDNYLRSSFKANQHLTSAAAAGFQQSLFDGQHNSAAAAAAAAAGFGVYPPLFQSPYFGIPSR